MGFEKFHEKGKLALSMWKISWQNIVYQSQQTITMFFFLLTTWWIFHFLNLFMLEYSLSFKHLESNFIIFPLHCCSNSLAIPHLNFTHFYTHSGKVEELASIQTSRCVSSDLAFVFKKKNSYSRQLSDDLQVIFFLKKIQYQRLTDGHVVA